jgi:hypothetical protein
VSIMSVRVDVREGCVRTCVSVKEPQKECVSVRVSTRRSEGVGV